MERFLNGIVMRVFRILSFPSCIVLPFYFPLSLSLSLLYFWISLFSMYLVFFPFTPTFASLEARFTPGNVIHLSFSFPRASAISKRSRCVRRDCEYRRRACARRRGSHVAYPFEPIRPFPGEGRGRAVPLPLVSIHRDAFTKGARAKKSQRSVSFPFVSSRQFLKDTMLRLFRRDKSALKREVYEGKNSYCWLYRGIAFAERLCLNMNRLFRIKPFLFCFEIK